VKRRLSPGRKKPINRPVSAKIIAVKPRSPKEVTIDSIENMCK
jgi:hypothetical protein